MRAACRRESGGFTVPGIDCAWLGLSVDLGLTGAAGLAIVCVADARDHCLPKAALEVSSAGRTAATDAPRGCCW